MDKKPRAMQRAQPDKAILERLSRFRWQLRRFMRFSEDAARAAGITMLHYQLLLHTQGFEGRDWATVGELAERLQAQPHGVVALVSRCEQSGLVKRKSSRSDRRQVEVHLLAKGRRCLEQLAAQHSAELSALAGVLAGFQDGAADAGATSSQLADRVDALDPDRMSPREALDALYRLKGLHAPTQ